MDITAVNQKISSYYTATAGDYFSLLKPRVMSLVIFTALIGLIVAPGEIHPVIGFTAILCIAIAAGASGCLNMWYEADIDAKMERTAGRPIPSGRIDAQSALHFGVALAVSSVLVMGLTVNVVAALLLTVTILLYVVVYTIWLKRRTAQNIVIGGASGAFPPMVAWAAVTGDVSLESFVLFAIIFMWTPPHFWALSLFSCKEYESAGIPMLPVVCGEAHTKKQIMLYTMLMVPVTALPWYLGFAGIFYGATSVFLGGIFIWLSFALLRDEFSVDENSAKAKKVFFFSIFYLFALFAILGLENLLWRLF
ncbi:MAG: protoheme IX farnesyltransferase [Kordiimonadaceae bacterium]|jgi:protoheme IX farnesyltransferase|nr:protoheme IX farnesyltransferase [Kordiimonadaceae bacterium]MBT6466143.1 protoheme IX farnesyltransferase [Kordiimonadaceae bacterium]MBT7605738.1 protoheme IX farnesyltransferase [Kordiimonadaceae bacterium]MDC0082411.1 heme o synthase [Emcibacteraceae bacterium]MDC1429365.1 heme o synthase [Emcibacteraceae bacterium]|tara:strand:+ start:13151 stop:14074 length:924 start_codon:yes stop_codon:yes gene_type:complete